MPPLPHSQTVRTIIVDDEPPARALVREYLEDFPRIEVVASCKNGREAVETVNDAAPDLIFLDVQMPGLGGFDVLERLDALPHIIFSTAHDTYALDAFDTGAIDYLLKPYSRARFRKAVERALARHDRRAAPPPDYTERIAALLQAARPADAPPDRLYVRHGDKILPVETGTIRWIEAAGDYAKIHTPEKTYLTSRGLSEMEQVLDPKRFARVHRSAIIALGALDHLRSDGSGGYFATLRDGTRVRVSRTYAPRIRDLLA